MIYRILAEAMECRSVRLRCGTSAADLAHLLFLKCASGAVRPLLQYMAHALDVDEWKVVNAFESACINFLQEVEDDEDCSIPNSCGSAGK